MNHRRISRRKGFALIEAMVAGLVMAFGMLAMVSMQLTLSRNADTAKARTEAMRLAQEQMEQLRSFTMIEPSAAGVAWTAERAWDNLPASGSQTVTTNNAYTVSWNVGNGGISASDVMKTVSVNVAWTDRGGEDHAVTLNSVISRTDPSDSGFLGFPLPQNTNLKRPKNRNINIPIPAVDLGGGKSGYQISPTLAVVFSNDSGLVIQKCDSDTPFVIDPTYDLDNCITSSALMIAGYITRASTSVPWPDGINYAGVTSANNDDINCKFGDATDQNTGAVLSEYKYYLCIIPVSDATDPPLTWSGTIRLGGIPAATSSDRHFVCRYQFKDTTLSDNARNIQPYEDVDESTDSQNYVIHTGNGGSCPAADSVVLPVLHQDCRPSNASRATDCPASSANNFS